MQRRLRIALAVSAAAGALALGAGTAFADTPDLNPGGGPDLNTPQMTPDGVDPGGLPSADQQLGNASHMGHVPGPNAAEDAPNSLVNAGSNTTPLDSLQK